MSIIRWQPMSSLSNWPGVFEDDDLMLPAVSNNLDVYETEDEVVVKANVAGVAADRVEVIYEQGVVRIKADKEVVEDDKQKQHYSRSNWNYSYRVNLPGASLLDHSSEPQAEVKDGVITVRFKKAEASKPKRLTVKTGS